MKMVSRIVLVVFVLLTTNFMINAQSTFGHEWIDANKTYYKLKVAQNGIYKVTHEELILAGFPSGNISGASLKLMNFGQEQAIYVSDNDFGPGDFFEFYGEKNTIGLDSLLYNNWSKDLFNPEYSLVTDTNAYFLTLSPETSNLRYTLVNPDYNSNTLAPFPYYLHTEKIVFSNTFFKNVDGDVRYSHFEPSEGFGDALQQTSSTVLNTSLFVDSGPNPVLSFRLGQNSHLSKLEISWNNQLKESIITQPKHTSQFTYTLDKSEIKSGNTLGLKNTNSANDRHRLAYVSLVYPRSFDFGNKSEFAFSLPAASGKRYLEISAFKADNDQVFVYEINKKIRYTTKINGGKVLAIVNPSTTDAKYIISNSSSGARKVNSIHVFRPKSYTDSGQEYIIISNKSLYATGPDYVKDYSDYRSSTIGGGYKTEIIEIQDVYDHFAYGIERHFLGIKQLTGYMKQNWKQAKFVMILGKGIEYPYMRTNNDVINNENLVFFVPTFGYVGSDNMLFSEKNFPDPQFAIGRVAARSAEDIKNYLDKVKQYDQAKLAPQTIEDKYWMKRVLHLSGGSKIHEVEAIKNGLLGMENVIENAKMGADVTTFYKTSTDVLQPATSAEIKEQINNGVNIITFFGHSAVGSFDFSLENPKEYTNTGKYHFINSLGCYSGNIHTTQSGVSESFILEKDKGAIGFLASSGTAFISSLSVFGREYYERIGTLQYGGTIGEINRIMANRYRNQQYSELAFYQQATLHGDPAIKLYAFDKPDYVFDYSSFKTEPKFISTATEKISVKFNIVNLGSSDQDSLDLRFNHQIPNGSVVDTVQIRVAAPINFSENEVVINNRGLDGLGKNILFGLIDVQNRIDEGPVPAAKENNRIESDLEPGFPFFILDDLAYPIYPPEFGIINQNQGFSLKASTSNALAEKQFYLFELDTTEYFNSPLLNNIRIESVGGIIVWKPSINLTSKTVYYWRVRPEIINPEIGPVWQSSSFIYLPESTEGWNQSHYFQYKKDSFKKLELKEGSRKLEFSPLNAEVRIRNKLWKNDDRPGFYFNFNRFSSVEPWPYVDAGIGVVVNNKWTMWHLLNKPGSSLGSVNPGRNTDVFPFRTDNFEDRKNLITFIEEQVKIGHYVTLFTIVNNENSDLKVKDWEADSLILGKNIFSVLEKLGAKEVRRLKDYGSVPYVFQAINDEEGVYNEEISPTKDGIIDVTSIYKQLGQAGSIRSKKIGPALKWESLDFKFSEMTSPQDVFNLTVYGIDFAGNETELISNITSKIDLNIDAKQYPYLIVEAFLSDSTQRTVPKMDFWRINYQHLPEAAVNQGVDFSFIGDDLLQGDSLRIKYEIVNINNKPMDSLLVKYTIIGNQNIEQTFFKRLEPLKPNGTIKPRFSFNTKYLQKGINQFIIEVNPNNDQPEQFHPNNYLLKQFNVNPDITNPLLDIYFDGIHIMDGDIVSPKPEIKISLKDDNLFLPITDPNLFEIKLDTGRNNLVSIPMNSPQIKFTPATLEKNDVIVHYYPNLKSGEYKLIVQAKDESGNKSGKNERSISFRVIEEEGVSSLLNYPNPFSTSTQFVFILTGEEIPDIMSISIMTISGKVVKEITKEELGPLHIGTNRTEYKWDGTDEYGSKLGNGVYLYKVNTRKKSGDKYNKFTNTKTDLFFKDGFGKLVILR